MTDRPSILNHPEAWAVVPVELSDEIMTAARSGYSKATGCDDTPHVLDGWVEEALNASFQAALAASPSPTALADIVRYVEGLEETAKDAGQLRRLFDQQWKRTTEAGELWRQAHPGNDNVRPDLGELVKWLMDRAEAAETRVRELEARLAEADELIGRAQQNTPEHFSNWHEAARAWRDK